MTKRQWTMVSLGALGGLFAIGAGVCADLGADATAFALTMLAVVSLVAILPVSSE